MLKSQTINTMFQPKFKMNFIPQMLLNPNQYMIKCVPQNVFFPLQDLYKGYTNSLRIKLPYTIDKTTLLNIFLFYGKIEFIDINPETNVVLIEYYKIISAIKCYAEFKFNFNKLIKGQSFSNQNGLLDISFVKKNFEEKFHLGFKIKEKELFKTKINTDCLIKIISRVGKILKIYQKMSYENGNNYPQQISLNTIFVFNDSRDKEKADFILRRIIMPYSGHNNQNNNRRFEETKECKEDNGLFNSSFNTNIINNNTNNNSNNNTTNNFDVLYEPESSLSSFPIIYQYMKKDDEIELKDDYDMNFNKSKESHINQPNTQSQPKNDIISNKENQDTINIEQNNDKPFHKQIFTRAYNYLMKLCKFVPPEKQKDKFNPDNYGILQRNRTCEHPRDVR